MVLLHGLNAALAFLGWRLGTVDRGGALAGFAVGAGVAAGLAWPGYLLLLAYFAAGVAATRIGWRRKAELGIAEARGGARGARQALANGAPLLGFGVAAGVFGGVDGSGGAVAAAGFVGAVVTATADTVSSEIGKALPGTVVRLSDRRPVPPGTPGGVSFGGTLAGGLAAAAAGALAAAMGLVAPPVAAAAAGCGFAAALLEGFLAPLESKGAIDNDGVNLLSVSVGGLLAAAASLGIAS